MTSDENGWRLAFGAPASVERPITVESARELTPEQIRQVAEILTARDAQNQEALAELVRLETTRSGSELRAEIEQIRIASDQNFQFQKLRWDTLYRDLSEANTVASVGR